MAGERSTSPPNCWKARAATCLILLALASARAGTITLSAASTVVPSGTSFTVTATVQGIERSVALLLSSSGGGSTDKKSVSNGGSLSASFQAVTPGEMTITACADGCPSVTLDVTIIAIDAITPDPDANWINSATTWNATIVPPGSSLGNNIVTWSGDGVTNQTGLEIQTFFATHGTKTVSASIEPAPARQNKPGEHKPPTK